ncbi:hypothetical protein [Aequorivita nionensis]|uniref:hypothetical protein n=1 Tax=Aequorivita nionensis TaxID=1287690 RepID=UPI003965B250
MQGFLVCPHPNGSVQDPSVWVFYLSIGVKGTSVRVKDPSVGVFYLPVRVQDPNVGVGGRIVRVLNPNVGVVARIFWGPQPKRKGIGRKRKGSAP